MDGIGKARPAGVARALAGYLLVDGVFVVKLTVTDVTITVMIGITMTMMIMMTMTMTMTTLRAMDSSTMR